MPFLSDKDKHDIVLAAENGFDYVAASFVNSAKNVNDIRKILNKTKNGSKVKIIAKIESTDGIKNLKEIVKASDGIMVARGDLGIEIPYYDVPYQQEQMVKLCREAGKPVIVATQMLDSMERQLMCTRAETTDVYYSVKIGADSTMTSGETAQGLFPIQAITSMVAINTTSEKLFDYDLAIANLSKSLNSSARKIALNIAKKVLPKNQCTLKATFPYELVVYFDDADVNLQAISAVRPAAHVVFITDDKIKATKYGVYYGISSYYVNDKKQAIKDYKKVIVNVTKLYAIGSKKVIAYLNNKFIH
jgi:pyruvate kinase